MELIVNEKELIDFIKKTGCRNIEPCTTIEKGYVSWHGAVSTICMPTIMYNYDDLEKVKSILRRITSVSTQRGKSEQR